MNVKMAMTLPLAIIFFVYGVYCPSIEEIPLKYSLKHCKSNTRTLDFVNSLTSNFDLECSRKAPFQCHLTERTKSGLSNVYPFKKPNAEFVSMEDEQLTLIMYPDRFPDDITWNVTCDFTSRTQARKFHKLMTRDRQSELVHFLKADYLKDSDDNVLAEPANLLLDGFEHDITIVIKNATGDAVLIFPQYAITDKGKHQDDPTKIDLYISINLSPPVLYKFGFSTPSQASAWDKLLNKLSQPLEATHTQNYRRPNRDPAIDKFFAQIKREIPR